MITSIKLSRSSSTCQTTRAWLSLRLIFPHFATRKSNSGGLALKTLSAHLAVTQDSSLGLLSSPWSRPSSSSCSSSSSSSGISTGGSTVSPITAPRTRPLRWAKQGRRTRMNEDEWFICGCAEWFTYGWAECGCFAVLSLVRSGSWKGKGKA
ncbi:uncharacterized protein LOC125024686 [Penaeus chinensis]|uniref:uncharacterized protein LOC125024686 n=1 Tax=Penaeus chinensis TaxID=139456 RepID=UPI001FB5E72C|nr:uncharacterized protein LOC125024686 [Penaeus chinensis]